MSLRIDIRQTGEVSIVDVEGRIVLGEDVRVLRELLHKMPREGHKNILINLGKTVYIDSSGLGVLVSGFASVANQGGQLKLLNLTHRIRDLLLITKLFTVFEVFDSEASAVASFMNVSASAS